MFNIFHRQRKPRDVFVGKQHEFVWEKRPLPSAGANSYAFLTQGLPVTSIARGNILVTNPLRETFPGSYAKQTAVLVGNPPFGYFQGQFVTQPLMNPNQASALGIADPNALPPGAYNAIPTAAPVLAP